MPDTTTLTSLAFIAFGLATWVVVLRAIAGSDPFDLGSVFGRPWELGWPRGVQEEEPQPWRFERLGDRAAAPHRIEVAPPATGSCDCEAEDVAA